MAGVINIGGENAGDAFYRYKMPKLQARIEGRGNGIKTNVVNCTDIAKALERPPDYILKYFGTELGAQTKYDKASGNSIVNGAHDASKLSELLEAFIKKYVQCYACGNPETVVKIKKESIMLKCKACGFVSEVDPRLKLNGYIVKNPPDVKLSKAEKKVKKAEKERMKGLEEGAVKAEKKDKKDKKKKEKGAREAPEANGGPAAESSGDVDGEDDDEEEEDDEVVWMTDTSEAAMKRRAAEQLSAATAAMVTQGNLEAEEAAARKKAEEEARRKAEEEEAARRKAEEEAEAARKKAEEEQAARLAAEAERKLALEALDPTVRKLRQLAEAGAPPKELAAALRDGDVKGGPAARMRVLYEALLGDVGEGEKLAGVLAKRAKYFVPHAADQAGQLAQLVAAEHLLGVGLAGRVREAPLLLKAMYDADLAEEDLILAWYNKANAGAVLGVPPEAGGAVRAAAKPFVEWLEEADSESDDEDDE